MELKVRKGGKQGVRTEKRTKWNAVSGFDLGTQVQNALKWRSFESHNPTNDSDPSREASTEAINAFSEMAYDEHMNVYTHRGRIC
jgi:hypothetical protein